MFNDDPAKYQKNDRDNCGKRNVASDSRNASNTCIVQRTTRKRNETIRMRTSAATLLSPVAQGYGVNPGVLIEQFLRRVAKRAYPELHHRWQTPYG